MRKNWIPIAILILAVSIVAYFLACGGGGDGPAVTVNEDGEYWAVNYNIRESSIGSTMDEIFNSTTIISTWGTLSIDNSTGQWTVYMGDIYNSGSAPYGMARHAHRLTVWDEVEDEGYFNPSYANFAPGEPYTNTYTLDGRRFLIYTEDGIINGAFSLDYKSFVGTNMEGMHSETIYAFKKPSSPPAIKSNGKYLLLSPYLEISYAAVHPDSGVVNGTEAFSISHELMVADIAGDRMVNWSGSLSFAPVYDPVTKELEGWLSEGPVERASVETGGLAAVPIRADGLMEMPDRFLALGSGGSGLMAGSAQEEDDPHGEGGFHMVRAGSLLELETSPTMQDIVGGWFLSAIESKAEEGPTMDGWGNGNEKLHAWVQIMDLAIDAEGNLTGSKLAGKDVFAGTVDTTSEDLLFKVHLVDECYKPDTALDSMDCTGGVMLPVFYINGVDAGGEYLPDPPIRFVIDSTHNVFSLWEPFDEDGVPCDEETSPGCGDAMPRFQLGFGVKYK